MWVARFKDKSTLKEIIPGQDDPLAFSHVLKRIDDLEQLAIISDNGMTFTVRLTDGLFSVIIGEQKIYFYGVDPSITPLVDFRPIYFVRERVDFNIFGAPPQPRQGTEVFRAVGFQANTKDGKNVQRYLEIYKNGVFVVQSKG